jgi:hypothetical protein
MEEDSYKLTLSVQGPESSLPCSQDPASGPYPKPD